MRQTLFLLGKQLTLAIFFVSTIMASAFAEDAKAACVFVSLENNAWVVHKDSQVKSSLKVGDVLNEGDKVIVNHNNRVQLAFDKECHNIVQIEGDATFALNPSKPASINLQNGKIFALLDNLPSGSNFTVETPTAIGAVRGTRFQVNTNDTQADFMVYKGKVWVSGRDKNGDPMLEAVVLNAGQKSSVAGLDQQPKPAESMTDAEKDEITEVSQGIDKTRQAVDVKQMEAWFNREELPPANPTSSLVKSDSPASDSSDKSKASKNDDNGAKSGVVVIYK